MSIQQQIEFLPHDVQHVLRCFADMGASEAELEQECESLLNDLDYCMSWCKATGFEPPRQYRVMR